MLFEIIFLSFGILLIVSAAANILRNMRIKKKGILVSATVVDIHRTSRAGKNKSRMQYHPVFEYRVNGNSINYVAIYPNRPTTTFERVIGALT
jgi:hypothetical protein